MFIEHEGRYLSKGVSLFSRSQLPIRFRLHLGESFHAEVEESAQQLSARLELYFRERLQNTGEASAFSSPLESLGCLEQRLASRCPSQLQ